MTEQPVKKEMKVVFPENLRGGVYANNMVVTHTKEEFILDFMMITPPVGYSQLPPIGYIIEKTQHEGEVKYGGYTRQGNDIH